MERGADLEGGRRGGTDAGQHGFGGEGPGEAGVGVATVVLQVRWGQERAQAGVGRGSLRRHRVHGLLGGDHFGRWIVLGTFRLPLVGRALWKNRTEGGEEGREETLLCVLRCLSVQSSHPDPPCPLSTSQDMHFQPCGSLGDRRLGEVSTSGTLKSSNSTVPSAEPGAPEKH